MIRLMPWSLAQMPRWCPGPSLRCPADALVPPSDAPLMPWSLPPMSRWCPVTAISWLRQIGDTRTQVPVVFILRLYMIVSLFGASHKVVTAGRPAQSSCPPSADRVAQLTHSRPATHRLSHRGSRFKTTRGRRVTVCCVSSCLCNVTWTPSTQGSQPLVLKVQEPCA